MLTMAPPRKKPAGAKRNDEAAIMFRLTPQENAALESFLKAQRVEPARGAVAKLALLEFLKKEGHAPEAADDD